MRWSVAPVLVAVGLVLSSCGGAHTGSAGVIARAVAATSRVGGAELSAVATVRDARDAFRLQLIGSESFVRHDALATLSLSNPRVSRTLGIRLRYPRVYVNAAPLLGYGRKLWLWFNLPDMLKKHRVDGLVVLIAQFDPARALAYLKRIRRPVQTVGSESVRGVSTTHYKVVSDLHIPGAKQTPVDVWVDSKDLVRRLRLELPLSQSTIPRHSEVAVTIDLSKFGPKPIVDPPAPHQTSSLSAFTAAVGR